MTDTTDSTTTDSTTENDQPAPTASRPRRRRAAGRDSGPPVAIPAEGATSDAPVDGAATSPAAEDLAAEADAVSRDGEDVASPRGDDRGSDDAAAPGAASEAEQEADEDEDEEDLGPDADAGELPVADDIELEDGDDDEDAADGEPRARGRVAATTLMFQAPSVAPASASVRRPRRDPEDADLDSDLDTDDAAEAEELSEPDEDLVGDGLGDGLGDDDGGDDGETPAGAARRRRRRGGRGRGRGGRPGTGAGAEDGAEGDDGRPDDEAGGSAEGAADEGEDLDAEDDGTPRTGSSSRRRRRRRRTPGSAGAGDDAPGPDDPPNTVTHVRDGVRGVSGSTRIEAKRQRRRDGRTESRRRVIVTEAEFLARRESVERTMVVRRVGGRTQVAMLEDGILVEHYVTRAESTSYAGNVYLGRVQNVLPGMEAAFVDIGKGRNAVLYAGEVSYDTSLTGGAKAPRIEQALKSGQSVLVQVTKDPVGHKGARLTSQVSLPGRFLVYVPQGPMTGISRKLPDTERSRLKAILKKVVPEDAGVIIRTAAEGASEEDITRDVERLQALWTKITAKAAKASPPALLHGEPDLVVRVVRDVFNEDIKELVVSGDDVAAEIEEYVGDVAPDLLGRVRRESGDVFATYRIDEQLRKALERKVHLPSGGSLVIDRTEALTAIDVNTGKFTGSGGNLEETVTRNNLEAAEEIARQLRLRDIGGMVVIDFIDMVLESNRELVLRRLVECLSRDRTKHQVSEVTSLGLVQLTRKRVGQGLLEAFSEPCPHCGGRGVLLHPEELDPGKPKAPSPAAVARAVAKGKDNGSDGGSGKGADAPAADGEGSERASRSGARRRRKPEAAPADESREVAAPEPPGDADEPSSGTEVSPVEPDEAPEGTAAEAEVSAADAAEESEPVAT